ncbi:MAG: phage DNA encapsidation protein [Bacteroidales bacterium]|nr:phage DNA encapsidation protein [Bacteroidales bacterium]MBP5709887.1 phage DNA encapsidation protein [Bacteroidales bacterium]
MNTDRFYTADGWVNSAAVLDDPAPFCICVGGRGIGKTFGTLKEIITRDMRFVYMRRTQAQIDAIKVKELNPFKAVNDVCGYDIVSGPLGKYMGGFWHSDKDGKAVGPSIGVAVALSTVSSIRGLSVEDTPVCVFDEFIKESHEKRSKNEDSAFLNCVETFNRNREFQGKPPMKFILLSNSNDMDSAILDALGALRPLDEMIRKRQNYRVIHDGALAIYRYIDSPISDKKKNTVLYKISKDGDFAGMALNNEFSQSNYENVKRCDIKQYFPLVSVGGMTVYEHKSERLYYVVDGIKSQNVYTTFPNSLKSFVRRYWYIKEAMLLMKVNYSSAPVKIAFEKIWG